MVQKLQRQRQSASFPETAPAANPVFFRTYSEKLLGCMALAHSQDFTLKIYKNSY